MASSESKKGIFTHTLVYSIGNFLSRGLNFILLPVYSHFIAPPDFGVYSVIISVVTIASTILNLGLPGIFVKNLSEVADAEQKRKFISNTISGISVLSLPFLLLVIFYSKQLSLIIIGDSQYNVEIILGVLSIYALNYSYYFSVFYVAEQNSKKYVLINSFAAIINFILNIILIVLLNSGINGIFISQILSSMFLIFLSGDVIKYFFRFEFDLKYLKPIMLSSLPLLLSGICTIAVELIDRFIVLKFLGEEQAGVYSFGYRIALIYNLFILSFKSAWIPHYFNLKEIDSEKKAEHLGRVFTKLIFLSSIAILTILILTEIFFSVKINSFRFFNPVYQPSREFIIYVMLGYFFSLIMAFYSIAPFEFNKTIHFFFADLIALMINLVLNFTLIPVIGVKGAAIATMIAFFSGAVYLSIYQHRKVKIRYELTKLLVILIISILAYIFISFYFNVFTSLSLIASLIIIGIRLNMAGKNLNEILKF